MREPDEILEPSFGLGDIPEPQEPIGYGKPPAGSRFKSDGGQNRNSSLGGVTRRGTIALRRMAFWSSAQEQPDGRTALQTITDRMVKDAMDGDPISQRLLFDQLAPTSAKLLLADDLASGGDDGLATIVIRDMTLGGRERLENAAVEAALRAEQAAQLGVTNHLATNAMVEATADTESNKPAKIFDGLDLDSEFEKATKGREPIEVWDDASRAEAARLLKVNPETAPDPNGPDPRDSRYRPAAKERGEDDKATRICREFFGEIISKRAKRSDHEQEE